MEKINLEKSSWIKEVTIDGEVCKFHMNRNMRNYEFKINKKFDLFSFLTFVEKHHHQDLTEEILENTKEEWLEIGFVSEKHNKISIGAAFHNIKKLNIIEEIK